MQAVFNRKKTNYICRLCERKFAQSYTAWRDGVPYYLIFARLNFRDFRDLKNFAKKTPAKIKAGKFIDLKKPSFKFCVCLDYTYE